MMQPKYLFVASEVRSGSTFASELIAYALSEFHQCELWDLTKEHFAPLNVHSTGADIRAIYSKLFTDSVTKRRTSKIMCQALSLIAREADTDPDVRETFFGPNTLWIIVRRRDRIAQAVSLAFAERSGVYHHYDEGESPDAFVRLQMADINESLKKITVSDVFLEAFAANISAQNVVSWAYEDILQDRGRFINSICDLLGLERRESVDADLPKEKLRPTSQNRKRDYKAEFAAWLMRNYYDTGESGETPPPLRISEENCALSSSHPGQVEQSSRATEPHPLAKEESSEPSQPDGPLDAMDPASKLSEPNIAATDTDSGLNSQPAEDA